ncbi:MFS transporter [Paeniglutamicibacter psychrophenolicus]|uniref:MFS transporter n=1 Tax=Paeniglutamicibacter psychrophenolicus TaxID=257454 RepID=UPI0027869CE2|nr:MFS transporter [Paeniglutamicibacter psychrophenolicus]MDQ0095873.1 MFS family permease [Paeniglutamicibacter psychrophenolicus]
MSNSVSRKTTPQPSPYAALPPLVGWAFFPLGFFARLPLAMLTIGSMTLLIDSTGSYAAGGMAAAMVGIGSAVGGPTIGYLSDRFGQRRVLVPVAVAQAILITALLWFGGAGPLAPLGVIVLLAILAGATGPQVGPLARVRWMALTRKRDTGGRELSAALSYESMVDELGFVLGPAAVGLFAALVAPWLPLAIAAVLTIVLVPLFAVHRTEKAVLPAARNAVKVKLTSNQVTGISFAVAGMIGMGTFFGASAAGTLAFAGALGNANIGGLLYAAVGFTSAIAALSVAFWPSGWPQASRWLAAAIFMVPAALALQLPGDLVPMIAALLIVGIPVGPVLVTIFTLGGEIAPRERLSTVMTLLSSGIVVGTAIGNSLAGLLADSHGYAGAYAVAAGAAGLILAAGIAMAILRQRQRRTMLAGHGPRA